MGPLKISLTSLILLAFNGCSLFSPSSGVKAGVIEAAESSGIPFLLTVKGESYDGSEIAVDSCLVSQVPFNPKLVGVRLTTFKDGIEIGQAGALVSEGLPASLQQSTVSAEEEVRIPLSTKAEGMTDYQLELVWGEDARSLSEGLALRAASIENLVIEEAKGACDPAAKGERDNCPVTYSLSVDLVNNSDVVLESATLGVGYLWIQAGADVSAEAVPENEERVELQELNLGAGEAKPLKLAFNREVPTREGGKFVPVVRLIR